MNLDSPDAGLLIGLAYLFFEWSQVHIFYLRDNSVGAAAGTINEGEEMKVG